MVHKQTSKSIFLSPNSCTTAVSLHLDYDHDHDHDHDHNHDNDNDDQDQDDEQHNDDQDNDNDHDDHDDLFNVGGGRPFLRAKGSCIKRSQCKGVISAINREENKPKAI